MKENLSRMLRSGVALLLAFCMVAGFVPTAVFAVEVKDGNDDGIINYVSFGASNTNGYGLTGYMPAGTTAINKDTANVYGYQRLPAESYPYLLAAALNEAAGGAVSTAPYDGTAANDPFEKVHVDQMAMSSMRMEELRFLLDETYPGDKYTDWRFYDTNGDGGTQGWFAKAEADLDTLRDVYKNAIINADVITLDMGVNNFGVFMNRAMDGSVDLDISAINPELAAQYAQAKAYVKNLVAQYSGEAALLLDGMNQMIDALAFTLVGFCTSFDVVMGKIQELNPDATVIVISIQNLLTGLSLEMPGFEQTLPLGEIFGAVINAANLYTAGRSPYRDSYLYADVRKAGRVEFFVDSMREYNGDPSTITENMKDCYNIYGDEFWNNTRTKNLEDQILDMVDGFLADKVAGAFDDAEQDVLVAIYSTSNPEELLIKFLADGANGFAQARAALELAGEPNSNDIVNKYTAVYNNYVQMKAQYAPLALDMAYDVIHELFRECVEELTLNFAALALDGPTQGAIEEILLGAVVGEAVGAIEKLAADPTYTYDVDAAYPDGFLETKVAQYNAANDPDLSMSIVKTVAAMGIRTGLSNSFYGHPTPYGHQQIANVILEALEEDTTGKDVVVEEVNILLTELYKLVETYGPEVASQVWAQWEEYGYVDAFETSMSELKGMLTDRYNYYTETALPAIKVAIDALNAEKDNLSAELAALKAALEAKKAELAEVVKNIEIGSVHTPDINIDVELGNSQQTQVPENDCTVEGEGIEAELEAAVKDLEHAVAVIEALIADIEADIADLVALAEQIVAAVAELEKTIADVAAAVEDLEAAVLTVIDVIKNSDGVVNQLIKSFEAARDAANAAVNVLELTIGTAETMMDDIYALIEKVCADADAMYNKFVTELPGCIEQIPEEAMMLIGGSVYAAQQAYEANKEAIEAALKAELAALAEEHGISEESLKAELAALAEEYGISEESLKAELAAIKALIAEEIEKKYAEIEADFNAQIEAKKAEAAAKLVELEAELKAYEAELAGLAADAAQDVIDGIRAQIDRVNTDIATVKADLEHAVTHLENAAQIAYEEIVAEVNKAYEEAVAVVEQKLAELKAAYDAAVASVEQKLAELKAAYDQAVEELTAAADQAIAELTEQLEKKLEELSQLAEGAIDGILDAIRGELTSAQEAIKEILKGNLEAVEDLTAALLEMSGDAIADAVEALIDAVMVLIEEASTADLVIDDSFKYVAIGDGSAATESYVEKLAAALNAEAAENGVDEIEVVNNAYVGNTVIAELENLSDVTDADLITIGFSNVEILNSAINNALNGVELDWAAIVGAENVHYVEELMAEVALKFAEAGIEGEYADMANAVIESYAYSAILYATELPQLINEINAVNPDALVIIVGMYNPMSDAVIALDENVTMDIGEYIDYLVQGVAVHGLAYSILTGNSIYVDAPAVQTVNTDTELGVFDLMLMIMNGFEELYPNAAGDDYIAAEIADALNITYVKSVLYSDVNLDGIVDQSDVALLFAYVLNTETLNEQQLAYADVNFDGVVDQSDLTKLFSYVLGQIESL